MPIYLVCLVVFVVLIIIGGLLLWKFLPSSTKESVREILPTLGNRDKTGAGGANDYQGRDDDSDGGGGWFGGGEHDVPPEPTFPFYTLCPDKASCCNGIQGLCDLPANKIMYGSLHNGGSSSEDGFLLAGNHQYPLEEALEAGYRGVNLDLGICGTDDKMEMKIIHGKCRFGSRDPLEVFTNIGTFLRNNPREVVLMPIEVVKDDEGNAPTLQQINDVMIEADIIDLMYQHDVTEADKDWPTLQQLIDRNERLLFFYYNSDDCNRQRCPDKFQEWFRYAAENRFSYEDVDAIRDTDNSCPAARGLQGNFKFFGLNLFVTNPLPSRKAAQTINSKEFLENQIRTCTEKSGLDVNVLFVDFWSDGDVVEVVQLENQRRADLYVVVDDNNNNDDDEVAQQQQQQEDDNTGQRFLLRKSRSYYDQFFSRWDRPRQFLHW